MYEIRDNRRIDGRIERLKGEMYLEWDRKRSRPPERKGGWIYERMAPQNVFRVK